MNSIFRAPIGKVFSAQGTCRCVFRRGQSPQFPLDCTVGSMLTQQRNFGQDSFFERFKENLLLSLKQNKNIQKELEEFREQSKKMEESQAVKSGKDKLATASGFTKQLTETATQVTSSIPQKIAEVRDHVIKDENMAKTVEKMKEVGKNISETRIKAEHTSAYRALSKCVSSVIGPHWNDIERAYCLYNRPAKLMKRSDFAVYLDSPSTVTAQELVAHKDFNIGAKWRNFKDSSTVIRKMLDMKGRYNDSENIFSRSFRYIVGSVRSSVEATSMKDYTSSALADIRRLDPGFTVHQFIIDLERTILPNILEAYMNNDVEVLEDWCTEAVSDSTVIVFKNLWILVG